MTDLIAHVEGKKQHKHASGRVASVVSGPVVVDVFEERWVEDLDLVVDTEPRDVELTLSYFFATGLAPLAVANSSCVCVCVSVCNSTQNDNNHDW